ncbi:MAG: hypothetical protein SGJ02_04815 [bacterium]|nr:hypothetical protein [bacterium]
MRSKLTSAVYAGMCALVLFSQQAIAQEDDNSFTLGLTTDLNSDYMWRGLNLYDGISVQPALDANYSLGEMGSIGANVWAHFSAEGGRSAAEKYTEVDYTAHWDKAFDGFAISLGHIWYTYPRDSDAIEDTAEFFGSISIDCPLSPYIEVFKDYDLYDNYYAEVGISHTFETAALGSTTPYVAIGYATDAEKVYADDSGITHVGVGTSFEFKSGETTITPNINYNFSVDDNTDDEFWIGLNLGYSLL